MSNNPRTVAALGEEIIKEVEKAIIGKRELLNQIITAVMVGGHVLIEDYPGLGKTLMAKSLATALGLDFRRIQFTPDLLPGDITGGYVFDRSQSKFELRKGPIFANIILADEINRASPKTQSALLEAMQEGQVTLEGETQPLPKPFIVLATQNPIEYEGTFPLPEAQLDRFIMKVSVGYPSAKDELEMLERRRDRRTDDVEIKRITNGEELLQLRAAVEEVHINPDLNQYIIDIVSRTRADKQVSVGASPRGSLALLKLSRAAAALADRGFVLPDDIKDFAIPALVHRLILKPDLWLKRFAAEEIITAILDSQPVPVIESGA
ncbi:MAG: MoxR family ATPase [Chloroflexi bacterium]|nr:MAG: MoxR family ATPase [Chloroflexota bacterium]MBL1194011.1 MoxR family ATPase [Chloroflexota bacterium]NOH11305.1 MoxR family ATPase [Chloroflexota bacterium]